MNTNKNVKLRRYCRSEILYNSSRITKNTKKTNNITTCINIYKTTPEDKNIQVVYIIIIFCIFSTDSFRLAKIILSKIIVFIHRNITVDQKCIGFRVSREVNKFMDGICLNLDFHKP